MKNKEFIYETLTTPEPCPDPCRFDKVEVCDSPFSKSSRKWDNGKLKYSLILPEFLEETAKVLTLGEVNHPPEADGSPSWQQVKEERYIDAMIRHLQAYRMGGRLDEDMGTHHMSHVAVNAMFIWWLSGVTK